MSIYKSNYQPSILFRNAHVNTIAPTLLRRVKGVNYDRKRIELPDGDFLDLDFSKVGSNTIVLVLHGLEGDSGRPYMRGMVRAANDQLWDAVAVNHRGCSGEDNRALNAYHSGKSEDVHAVVLHLEQLGYDQVFIVGFSLGGNMALKYAGEQGDSINKIIKGVAGVSVPCHLEGSAQQLKKAENAIYLKRFLNTLKLKALVKKERFPDAPFTKEDIVHCKSFHDFDEVFTARVNGFDGAVDYWTRCSSSRFLETIKVPTLLVNAMDDPFLETRCFPREIAEGHEYFHLMMPKRGGHVGFSGNLFSNQPLWTEQAVPDFFNKHLVPH